jgi:hypothetical protein
MATVDELYSFVNITSEEKLKYNFDSKEEKKTDNSQSVPANLEFPISDFNIIEGIPYSYLDLTGYDEPTVELEDNDYWTKEEINSIFGSDFIRYNPKEIYHTVLSFRKLEKGYIGIIRNYQLTCEKIVHKVIGKSLFIPQMVWKAA